MNLTQCPYDGAQVDVAVSSGGSLLLTCMACSAVWERHGAWTGRVREPDREKLIAARRCAPTVVSVPPLPIVPFPMVPLPMVYSEATEHSPGF